MKIIGVIPSRYASARFPGKPLAIINGKSMIRRVWEQAKKSRLLSDVIVATDDSRIYDHVKGFGGSVLMTTADHQNGTSRCNEVLDILSVGETETQAATLINIQGDEPFINPVQIDQVAQLFQDTEVEIGTLARKITDSKELFNPNVVKVVKNSAGKALYFSRQTIPFVRDADPQDWLDHHDFYKHIGIYGYRSDILSKITKLKSGLLEETEKLEQLRWLEQGFSITVATTEFESLSVDTPEDLSKLTNSI